MSIITITAKQVSGVLFRAVGNTPGEIAVGKGVKAPVTHTGYLAAGEVKNEQGVYVPTAFGRIRIRAAEVVSERGSRMVLEVGGGLHGVLFPAAAGKNYDFSGRIEAGDGQEFPIFARVVQGKNGEFLSFSSMEREQPRERQQQTPSAPSRRAAAPAPEPAMAGADDDFSDDIPF